MFRGLGVGLGLGLSFSSFVVPRPSAQCSLKDDYFRRGHNITSTPSLPKKEAAATTTKTAFFLGGRRKCISDAASLEDGRRKEGGKAL